MLVWDGKRTRRWMFSQRSEGSAFHDGLMEIFNKQLSDSETQEEVQTLLEANEDLIQIHQ